MLGNEAGIALGILLVLLIGVVVGTYSSIGVASQLLVSWEYGDLRRVLGRRSSRTSATA